MNRTWIVALGLGAARLSTSLTSQAEEPALAAPSGFQGAGLGMGDQRVRAWAEVAFHKQEAFTVVAPTIGLGYRVLERLELEAMLPIAHASFDFYKDESGTGIGNPYLGVNYLELKSDVRYKLGAGISLPLASNSVPDGTAVVLVSPTFGSQDLQLWFPDTLGISLPGRIETGKKMVIGADAAVTAFIPTGDGRSNAEVEAALQVAPGVGVYAADQLLLGVRLPVIWVFTSNEGDNAQVALEPYARLDLGKGFLNARFTMNLDEPSGFAFDKGKFWGAHVGGGVAF